MVILRQIPSMVAVLATVFGAQLALAHNGAATFATPISNIRVDGDLSDWPDGMKVHVIGKTAYGQQPTSDNDFSGKFRVGYDLEKKTLYVAVEVMDDSRIYDDQRREWDSQEGCAIYIDRQQVRNGLLVEQYFLCGRKLRTDGAAETRTSEEIAKVRTHESKDGLVYEWEVPLDEELQPGATLGFDVDITDKDEDGSFTWMGWGTGTQKVYYLGRLGHLHLAADGDPMTLVQLTGQVRMEEGAGGKKAAYPAVSIQSTDIHSRWTLIPCDENGTYKTELPVGSYRVNALDSSELRVDDSVTIECKLEVGKITEADVLTVPPLQRPTLSCQTKLVQQDDFDSDAIDEFVSAYQEYHRVPGLSLAIIKNGEVCHCKNYGVQHAISRAPLESDTVFEACSLTKPIFAYAVHRLVEKGVLDFQTPLYRYKATVPGYEDVADDPRYQRITAQHVLAHRTGFPNWRSGKLTIDFDPGKGYGYSGEGFELLGAVVSHLTGKPLVQVIDEEVFQPLGIQNGYLDWNEQLAARTANGHILGTSPVVKTRNYEPGMAHSLHIDAENYAKFLLAILHRKGLKKETFDAMLSQQFEIADPNAEHEYPYGLGLVVQETPLGKKYSHGGVNTGWRCRFAIFDDLNAGYVVFTNSDRGDQFGEDLEQFLVTGRKESAAVK